MKTAAVALALVGLLSSRPVLAQRPDPVGPASPTVRVEGAPGSYQVVSVPVPDDLGRDSVAFSIVPDAEFPVLGPRDGWVGATAGSVLVTIGIPRSARAGEQEAARVLLHSPAGGTSTVPVLVAVDVVRRVTLATRERVSGLRPGEDVQVMLTLLNAGNAPDTLHLELALPEGWKLRGRRPEPLVLAGGASAVQTVQLRAPEVASVGDHFLKAVVTGSGGARAERLVTLAVGDRLAGELPPGPVLETSLGTVSVDGAAPVSVAQLAAHGPVTGTIGIDARAGFSRTLLPAELRGLARVGSYVADPQLSLWSERGRIGVGSAFGSISELTGTNVGGKGLTLAYAADRWGVSGLAARPINGTGGHLVGARTSVKAWGLEVGASGSDFLGAAGDPRRLTSAGLDAASRLSFGRIGGGLAYRDFGSGRGVGAAGSFESGDASGHLAIRAQHAPGGTQAFARAGDELELTGDRWIGALNVAARWASMRDQNPGFRSLSSTAWSLAPQYRLSSGTTVRLEARGDGYDAANAETGFGSVTRMLALAATSGARRLLLTTEIAVGRATRRIETGGIGSSSSGPQLTWHTDASYLAPFGRLQVDQSYERHGGMDLGPDQLSLAARAEQLHAAVLPAGLQFEAELAYQRVGANRSFATVRGGASYPLPQGVEVRVSVERNPLYSNATGATPWMTSVRLAKAVALPRLRYGAASGLVFQDLNGNGRRDADEEGVPNVTVRQGAERATSDRNGELVFWQSPKGAVTVEPAGLPYGWIIGDVRGPDPRLIPLVPTSSVRVVLDLASPDRARGVDLTPAVVTARDASGRQWIARRDAADRALFDVLPVGEYTLSFDFNGVREPMHVEGEHGFTVRGRGVETVKVLVQGRPLRFRIQSEQSR